MDALIGHTGFVGGNLLHQHDFGLTYNTGNIADLAGQSVDTLVCCGVPGTMWLANNDPEADRANILDLFRQMKQARVARVVLISTIAVYADPSVPTDESSAAFETELAYGRHRRELEERVAETFEQTLILRLPALFGQSLKKNFLFDLLNPVPSFLKPEDFERLRSGAGSAAVALLEQVFVWQEGPRMWRYDRGNLRDAEVQKIVEDAQMTARNFTNPDSNYQFYDLSVLWRDIEIALTAGIEFLNLATQPIAAGEIAETVVGRKLAVRDAPIVRQDLRSCHATLWQGSQGYLQERKEVMARLTDFLKRAGAAT